MAFKKGDILGMNEIKAIDVQKDEQEYCDDYRRDNVVHALRSYKEDIDNYIADNNVQGAERALAGLKGALNMLVLLGVMNRVEARFIKRAASEKISNLEEKQALNKQI